MRMRKGLLPVAALLLAVAPASASGAQRFASPAGSGSACSAASPCSLVTAVNSAPAGASEVIVAGNLGPYGSARTPIGTQLNDPAGATDDVHGAAGQPVPVVFLSVNSDYGILLNNAGTLSNLDVRNVG